MQTSKSSQVSQWQNVSPIIIQLYRLWQLHYTPYTDTDFFTNTLRMDIVGIKGIDRLFPSAKKLLQVNLCQSNILLLTPYEHVGYGELISNDANCKHEVKIKQFLRRTSIVKYDDQATCIL